MVQKKAVMLSSAGGAAKLVSKERKLPKSKPQTPKFEPQNTNPKPQNLNPKPQNLNPKPQNLNPKPQISNPKIRLHQSHCTVAGCTFCFLFILFAITMIIHLFKLIWVILALAIIVFIGLHSFSSEPLLCRFHATHCSSLTVTLCYLVGSLLLNGVLLLVKPGHADTTDFQRASKLTQFGRHRTVTVVVPIYSTGSSTKKVFFEYYIFR